jgi:uncharacterized membrane protein YqjE
MMNVLLKLCVLEPQLLMAHVKSYSDLMVEGIQQAVRTWKLRVMMFSIAVICALFGLLSTSVSILLWAALPILNEQNSWALIVFPVVLFVLSGLFLTIAKSFKVEPLFNEVQDQLQLDLLAICQASAK